MKLAQLSLLLCCLAGGWWWAAAVNAGALVLTIAGDAYLHARFGRDLVADEE